MRLSSPILQLHRSNNLPVVQKCHFCSTRKGIKANKPSSFRFFSDMASAAVSSDDKIEEIDDAVGYQPVETAIDRMWQER